MKMIIRFLISALTISLLATTAQAEHMNIMIVHAQDQDWMFRRVLVFHDQGAVNVSGRIVTRGFAARLPGHVDVAIYDRSGALIEEKPVNYYPPFAVAGPIHKFTIAR